MTPIEIATEQLEIIAGGAQGFVFTDAVEKLRAVLAKITDVTADRDRLAALLADASAAFDAGDIATLTTMRAAALQTESEKKLAAALAKKAEAEAEIAALTE